MNEHERKLRAGADQIGSQLVPNTAHRDEHFWCKHWPTLREIMSVRTILVERRVAFTEKRSRNNALSLVLFIDLAWQISRSLGGLAGNDLKWLQTTWLRRSEEAVRAFDLLLWVYEMHSTLRHPQSNWPKNAWLLNDPWPSAEGDRLLDAALVIWHLLRVVDVHFNPETGYEGEIIEKQALATKAEAHWRRIGSG
jgi:hypothetical protein